MIDGPQAVGVIDRDRANTSGGIETMSHTIPLMHARGHK